MKREITKDMLADVEWLNRQLKTMGSGYNKHITSEFVGRTVDFIKGVLYERERIRNEINLLARERPDLVGTGIPE